jgi:WD40 repeat protein
VWDAVTLARVRSFADWQDPVAAVKFDPTGKILAAGAEVSGAVAYFDTVSGKQVRRSKGVDSGIVYAMASTPDLRVWACSLNWRGGYWVKLWEPETERELHTFETRHKGDVTWVAIRADGKVVASADLSGNVRCWDIEGGKLLSDIMRPEKMYSVELSPLGSSLAYGGEESAIGFADFP